ncbi:MAG: hypothetical protein ACJKTH_02175 [Patescibacteria group bacterium UBA2163]
MNQQKQKKEPGPSLDEVYKLAKENNRMLKAMRRDAFIGAILKFVFWIAILFVIPYILYTVYLQPHLVNLQNTYNQFNQKVEAIDGASQELQQVRESLPEGFNSFLEQFGIGG